MLSPTKKFRDEYFSSSLRFWAKARRFYSSFPKNSSIETDALLPVAV